MERYDERDLIAVEFFAETALKDYLLSFSRLCAGKLL